MLVLGQKVRLINRSMLHPVFSDEGEVIKVHEKDNRVGWVIFLPFEGDLVGSGISETLNLHETELEVLNE